MFCLYLGITGEDYFETDSDIEAGSVQGEGGHVIVHPLMNEIRGYFGSRLDCAHMPCSNVGHGFELGLHTSTSSGVASSQMRA
jgi:hypothetical protein